jgi:predicted nucleic acid-binding protein
MQWLRTHGELCYLSVVSLTEIAYGIAWLRHRGATAKATRLSTWHQEVVTFHDGRIIQVTIDIAERAGRFLADARAAGFEPDTEDAWIAATADARGMEVLTFNEADFRPMGVSVRNPLKDPPPVRSR